MYYTKAGREHPARLLARGSDCVVRLGIKRATGFEPGVEAMSAGPLARTADQAPIPAAIALLRKHAMDVVAVLSRSDMAESRETKFWDALPAGLAPRWSSVPRRKESARYPQHDHVAIGCQFES
jgi:hypothetical protein